MATYTPILDRRYKVLGTYNGGTGLTTWTLPIADADCARLILGSAFGGNSGAVYNLGDGIAPNTFALSGTSATATGDFSAGYVIIGTDMPFYASLTTPYPKTKDNNDNFTAYRQIRHIDIAYTKSGPFSVSDSWNDSVHSERVRTCAPTGSDSATASGVFRARLNGNAAQMALSIYDTGVKRINISSVFFEIDSTTRRDN